MHIKHDITVITHSHFCALYSVILKHIHFERRFQPCQAPKTLVENRVM